MAWNAPNELRASRSSRGNDVSLLGASCLDDFTVYDSARISVDSRASDYLATLGCSRTSHVSAVSADFGRMFVSNQTADSFEVRSLLRERNGSVASCEDEAMASCNDASVGSRRHSGGRRAPIKKRIPKVMKDINFDPAPAPEDDPKPQCQGRARRDDGKENPCPWLCEDASDADAVQSLVSLIRDCEDASDADAVQSLLSLGRGGSREEQIVEADPGANHQNGQNDQIIGDGVNASWRRGVSYEEALQSLADSMRRTERSRRQVMLQRAVLGARAPPFFPVPGGAPAVYSDPLSGNKFPCDAVMGGERQGSASAHFLGREQ